jgi:dihydroorotase
MKDRLLIKGARVICPANGIDKKIDVLVDAGEIKDTGVNICASDGAISINATGLVLAPGLIDLHCHLREPGFEYKETVRSGTAAAVKGGFTTICAMPNTNPVTDNASAIESLMDKAKGQPARVLPIGSATKNSDGKELTEMADMVDAGAIGFSDDGNPISSDILMRHALEYSSALGVPIIDHCEVSSLFTNGQINEGWIASRLGLQGIPAAAEEQMVNRNISLAKLTGGWVHLAHVSTKGSVDSIRRAKKLGVRITAEATPHHLTLTEEAVLHRPGSSGIYKPLSEDAYNTMSKVNPPLRTQEDVDALVEGLADGIIDIIATDHAPHAYTEKLCPMQEAAFGISNLETAFASALSLVHNKKLNLPRLIESMTSSPARLLQTSNKKIGQITKGFSADLTLFDINTGWTVDTNQFVSKGKNSPLHGQKLKGKVILTMYKGKVVYSELNKDLLYT